MDFERLSALDRSFLAWETPTAHMHVACTMVFDAGPLRTEDGGVDFEAIRKAVIAALPRVPRYRQRLAFPPLVEGAWWVDDGRFRLDRHLRRVALPRPGSDRALAELASWIMQQPLDRTRPLWEMWVVEGLEGDRFAVISKVHHAMVDGIAGVDLMQRVLSPDPEARPRALPLLEARPTPGRLELLRGELRRRVVSPRALLPANLPRLGGEMLREATIRVAGLARSAAKLVSPATTAPWNVRLGPGRRLAWLGMDLDEVRALSRSLDATLNDVVLATVAGALRRTLRRHGIDPGRALLRVLAPVSVRSEGEQGTLGNRVSLWIVDLPVDEPRARRRLTRVREQTRALKASRSALGAKLLADAAEWTSSTLLSLGARAATALPAFNLIVTNVPGPQVPLYLAGARLRETWPVAPLFEHVGLAIALMSYDGRLFWGVNADEDAMPELDGLREDLAAAYREFAQAAIRRRRGARARGA